MSKQYYKGRFTKQPNDRFPVGEVVELTGVVDHIFSQNPSWMAGKLRTEDGEVFCFAGKCSANKGETITIRGPWTVRGGYEAQVQVESLVLPMPTDRNAIAMFLEKSEEFVGIGKSRARAIADAAGDDFEGALQNPAELAQRARVPVDVIEKLATRWREGRDYNAVASTLARFNVTPARARKLIEQFGASIVHTIETDPYWLIGRVPGMGFKSIDVYALAAGLPKNAPGRIEAALAYVIGEASRNGHTWIEGGDLVRMTTALLTFDCFEDEDLVAPALFELANKGRVSMVPLDGERWAVFRSTTFKADDFAYSVAQAAGAETGLNADWANEAFALSVMPTLYPMQAHACAVAWSSRLCVITGGAGVGKTYVVQAIREGATQRGLTVALCATSGKAAKRLAEAVGADASTIHRLLGCKLDWGVAARVTDDEEDDDDQDGDSDSKDVRFTYLYNETNSLPHDLVVVDEVSMLNAQTAYELLRAIDFTKTQVVLVGDHNQLPPVGAGALLRDLMEHRPCPIVELNQIVRQAGALKVAVNEILDGRVHAPILRAGGNSQIANEWMVLDSCKSPSDVAQTVARVFSELGRLHIEDRFAPGGSRLIDPVWDVLYLAPMKVGDAGIRALNALLQREACARAGRPVPPKKNPNQAYAIGVGDRVLWGKNDYTLDIMNGTLGQVLAVLEKDQTYEVKIPKGELPPPTVDEEDVTYVDDVPYSWTYKAKGHALVVAWQEPRGNVVKPIPAEKLKKLDLAYAMTIHKAQGSEAPVVVCVCAKAHSRMLTRNLFYTGVSRARKACYMVGDRWAMQKAASSTEDFRRRTIFSIAYGTWRGLIGSRAPSFQLRDDSNFNEAS